MKTPKTPDRKVKLWSESRKNAQRFFLRALQYIFEAFVFYVFTFLIGCYFLPVISTSIGAVVSQTATDGSLMQSFSLFMLPSVFVMLMLCVLTCLIIYKIHKKLSDIVGRVLAYGIRRNEKMYRESKEK